MYVSQQLRKNNIAEFLLYMWQVEDIIRAYDCSLTRIRREYINQFEYTDEQKEEMTDWYGNLVKMMNQEGVRAGGHLQINRIVLQQLEELHNQLLDSGTNPPEIEQLTKLIDDYCLGYKLPGAGGGGYLYMIAKDADAAVRIRETLTAHPLNRNARFVEMNLSKQGFQCSRS